MRTNLFMCLSRSLRFCFRCVYDNRTQRKIQSSSVCIARVRCLCCSMCLCRCWWKCIRNRKNQGLSLIIYNFLTFSLALLNCYNQHYNNLPVYCYCVFCISCSVFVICMTACYSVCFSCLLSVLCRSG